MKTYDCKQGSEEWLNLRCGIPTASEFSNVLTPEFKVKKGHTPEKYLAQKVAERWEGGPVLNVGSFAMEFGSIRESEARPWFEFTFGKEVTEIGFVTSDDGKLGASPDGLIGDDDGLEIKCPQSATQARYLIDGVVPEEYIVQVMGAMYVTGRPFWTFVSYRRNYPALVLRVSRDEKIMASIKEALDAFCVKLENTYQMLCEKNGGPPERNTFEHPQETSPELTGAEF